MKNSKKIVALVMAMVMIFALTASALAGQNSTMKVYVTIKGVLSSNEADTITVCTNDERTITSGSTVYHLIKTMSDLKSSYAHNAVWKTVDVVDANGNQTGTANALVSLSCTVPGRYMSQDATYEYVWGGNSRMIMYTSSSVFGGTTNDGNYVGTDWVYSVTRGSTTVEPTVYMDQYTLQDGDHVTLTYKYDNFSWSNPA